MRDVLIYQRDGFVKGKFPRCSRGYTHPCGCQWTHEIRETVTWSANSRCPPGGCGLGRTLTAPRPHGGNVTYDLLEMFKPTEGLIHWADWPQGNTWPAPWHPEVGSSLPFFCGWDAFKKFLKNTCGRKCMHLWLTRFGACVFINASQTQRKCNMWTQPCNKVVVWYLAKCEAGIGTMGRFIVCNSFIRASIGCPVSRMDPL